MSENPINSGELVTPDQKATKTAGAILRAAREREGLHVAALAVSMKVPVKKLEALESDRLDLLPDAVFVRALAASVCRALKLDPTSVLELLPNSNPPKLRLDGRGINTPFDTPRHGGTASIKDAFAKPTVVIVGLLLLAALGVYFFPEAAHESKLFDIKSDQGDSRSQPTEAYAPLVVPAPSEPVTESKPSMGAMPSEVKPSLPAPKPDAVATIAAPAAVVASGVNFAGQMPIASPNTPVSESTVSFKAKGAAWVQVTDAKGVQLISRTLAPGEAIGISGALPFAVIVGRSDLTAVEVRGKSFDLSNVSQNNVARFEIKP